MNPEDAGIKAAEKASEKIMLEANKKAKDAAKLEAKKEVEKVLNITALPPGSRSNVTSRFVEEMNVTLVIGRLLSNKRKVTKLSFRATCNLFIFLSWNFETSICMHGVLSGEYKGKKRKGKKRDR